MPENARHKHEPSRRTLYPAYDPFEQGKLDVSGGHTLYYEQSGNPDGIPVVVLHGGPGGGCSPGMRRFFNPERYRVVLFDQRGCGRSRPYASVENNTTWDLIEDIEAIREKLGIESWVVFGGSWGSTLGLLYGQTHPDRVIALVLRGIFTMTRAELDWFYNGGAGKFWPDVFQRFAKMVPPHERHDLIEAYRKRLFGPIEADVIRYARAWTAWENSLASLESDGRVFPTSAYYARAFALIENHYFSNGGFLRHERQIWEDMPKLKDVKGYIVQGRYDMICPPHTAHALHEVWPDSEMRLVKAGHAMSEPATAAELVSIMDSLFSLNRP